MNKYSYRTLLGVMVVLAGLALSNSATSDTPLTNSSDGVGFADGQVNDANRSGNNQPIDFRAEQYRALMLDIIELSDTSGALHG